MSKDSDEIISINRENKINFLNFIYQTKDNYIIASSDKQLIKNSIIFSNDFKEKKFQYQGELLGLKNEKNILFAKKFGQSIFFNNEILVTTLPNNFLSLLFNFFFRTLSAFSTLLFLTSIVIAILVLKFYLGYILNPGSRYC